MQNFRNAAKTVFKSRNYVILSVFVFLLVNALYLLAIEYSASIDTFLKSSKPVYVLAQLVFSLINASLIALSISFFVYSFKQKQLENNLNFIQSFVPAVFTVITTGCYVCGNLLIPTFGLGVSFLTLPFGGLEVKILSSLFVAYTLIPLSKEVLGICEIRHFKTYKFNAENISFNFSFKRLYNLAPLFTSAAFIAAIFILPTITSALGFNTFLGSNESFVCTENHITPRG